MTDIRERPDESRSPSIATREAAVQALWADIEAATYTGKGWAHRRAQVQALIDFEIAAERDAHAEVVRDTEALVGEFHRAFGLPVADAPTIPEHGRQVLRLSLIAEEHREFVEAWQARDLIGIADALADLVYVIYGAALEYGIPLPRVLAEVHRSNMSKLGEDGKPVYRSDGKVLKGPNYSPPSLAPFMTTEEAAMSNEIPTTEGGSSSRLATRLPEARDD